MICLFDLTIILCLMDVRNPKIYALKKKYQNSIQVMKHILE